MSKLNASEKIAYDVYKRELLQQGGRLFSFPDLGMTIAIRPQAGGNSAFAFVAVARCSERDKFKRKRGELIALGSMRCGEGVSLKLDNYRYEFTPDVLEAAAVDFAEYLA
jgi:hypothetical protein